MKTLAKALSLLVVTLTGTVAVAQEDNSRGYNPNSVRPIHESDIMYKRTVWRRVDFNEKQNRPFFAKNAEISRFIINAVKAGLLTPYTNDSLTTKLTLEQFNDNLKLPTENVGLSEEEKKLGFKEEESDWGGKDAKASNAPVTDEYFPTDIKIMEMKEDIIFDKKRSRIYYDIQSLTMILPGVEGRGTGLDKQIATFKYKDLEKLFRNDPKAIWFNAQNNQQHKNLADAFELRLFSARIIKVSNPDDLQLVDIYEGSRRGLIASQMVEQQLMEYEHNLWEF